MSQNDQFMSKTDPWDQARNFHYDSSAVFARLMHHGALILHGDWVTNYVSDPWWRLYCNLDEGASVWSDEREIKLHAGELYVLPAWLRWRGQVRHPFRHMFLGIEIPYFSQIQVRNRYHSVIHIPEAQEITEAWQRLNEELLTQRALDPLAYSQLYQIIYRILERLFQLMPPEAVTIPQELRELCNYIEQHLDQDLSNDVLAAQAFCSSGHLVRQFKSLIKQTPASYVRERRICAAAQRLTSTGESIEVIAESLGFPNRHHFTRVFTQTLGCSPARYRKYFNL